MSRELYDQTPGCNFSTLKELLRSPAHYQAALNAKATETEEDRARFMMGSAIHSCVLESKTLTDIYAIKPAGMSFATKDGKMWREYQTLPIMSADMAVEVDNISKAVLNHPLARGILNRCAEREAMLQADIDGVLCKGLIDALGKDASGFPIVVDLKSTQDARARKFRQRVEWDFHYDLQASLYTSLARECDRGDATPLWIVVETTPPYAVIIYQPSAELIDSGKRKLQTVLELWKSCNESGIWPGYPNNNQINEL